MKRSALILLVFSIIVLLGCSKSLIKITFDNDEKSHLMFGRNPGRDFYYPVELSDSLKLLWEEDVYGSFSNSSVVVKDSLIFTSDLGGRIHCFDLLTGKQLGVLRSKGSVFSAPLISNYKIIYALVIDGENKTELIIYDLYEGKELFNFEISGRVVSEMILDQDNIILCTENGEVIKISSAAKKIWSTKIKSKIYSNPALLNDRIFITDIDGNFLAIDSKSGNVIYKNKISGPVFSGITVKNNNAFFADNNGVVYCVDISNGKLIWQFESGNRIKSNPALDDINIYIGDLSGNIYSIDQVSGVINWETKLDGVISTTPAITNNKILVVNLDRSFSILNKHNGSINKSFKLNGRGKLSPVLYGNILILGYDDGILSAYEIIY